MIQVTDEMAAAFATTSGWASTAHDRAGLAAVLAIVERDYRVEPRPSWDREPPPSDRCPYCRVSLEAQCPWHQVALAIAPTATTEDRCVWCHRPGHVADQHPLPKDHPQYDAFYDASDDELAAILETADRPGTSTTAP